MPHAGGPTPLTGEEIGKRKRNIFADLVGGVRGAIATARQGEQEELFRLTREQRQREAAEEAAEREAADKAILASEGTVEEKIAALAHTRLPLFEQKARERTVAEAQPRLLQEPEVLPPGVGARAPDTMRAVTQRALLSPGTTVGQVEAIPQTEAAQRLKGGVPLSQQIATIRAEAMQLIASMRGSSDKRVQALRAAGELENANLNRILKTFLDLPPEPEQWARAAPVARKLAEVSRALGRLGGLTEKGGLAPLDPPAATGEGPVPGATGRYLDLIELLQEQ